MADWFGLTGWISGLGCFSGLVFLSRLFWWIVLVEYCGRVSWRIRLF